MVDFMSLNTLLLKLREKPEEVEFDHVMAVVDDTYNFSPTSFKNGKLVNEAGENSGSCKIFAFGQRHELTALQTLACFGRYYREDVLQNPNDENHQNIRNFMKFSWSGISFGAQPLSQKRS